MEVRLSGFVAQSCASQILSHTLKGKIAGLASRSLTAAARMYADSLARPPGVTSTLPSQELQAVCIEQTVDALFQVCRICFVEPFVKDHR
jgi:hypothetical protein